MGILGAWQVLTFRKIVPMGPRNCIKIVDTGKATLFDRVVQLGSSGMAMDTREEQINMHMSGRYPRKGEISGSMRAHFTYALRHQANHRLREEHCAF
jgi:hypothetical protein